MSRYDFLIDGGYYRVLVGREAGVHPSQVRPDGRRLLQYARALAKEHLGLDRSSFGSVRWYDGKLPDSAPAGQLRHESKFIAAMNWHKVQLRTAPLKPNPVRVAGPLKSALLHVEQGFDPLPDPRLIAQIDARLEKLHASSPTYVQKGIDTLLVMDLIELARTEEQTTILFAGDGDFAPAVHAVTREDGAGTPGRVALVEIEQGTAPSWRLREAASQSISIDIGQLTETLHRPERRPSAATTD